MEKLGGKKSSIAAHQVGLDSKANDILFSLSNKATASGSSVIQIYEMGGIGKTTIAKKIYNLIHDKLEASCFLENVREKSVLKGMEHLQKQLLYQTFKIKYKEIINCTSAARGVQVIQERLCHKRVLDDIDDLDQIEKILGSYDWLYHGSRVIITTRIQDLLANSSILYQQYEVKNLDDDDALKLLSLHAFNKCDPPEEYMDSAKDLVCYARGIPLAIEVLGSSLCGQ